MKIEQLHQLFLESSGICTDTRKITKDCIFFALKGENFNGNTFAHEALAQGAKKVVIDDIRFHKNTGETILYGSALKLLQKLASYHKNYLKIPVIGLTGSNGKTTTKELIYAVLSQKYETVATAGNLNNHIGVPLTLLSMKDTTQIGVVEMGANHLNEIAQLCEIALPDYGYITNFGKAHLEGFGSLEGVVKGKSELYNFLKNHQKKVFVNGNDKKQLSLTSSLNRVTFGNEQQDYYIQLKDATDKVIVHYQDTQISSNLIGLYNFHNIAAAIAMGAFFDVSIEHIKYAIETYVPTMNRSQIVVKEGHKIILDAYNANPTSMMAALENFQQASGANKWLILGDMFELGNEAQIEHLNVAKFLKKHPFGKVLLVGSNFYDTKISAENITLLKTFEELQAYILKHLPKKTYMLIKGSRGMALERVLDAL